MAGKRVKVKSLGAALRAWAASGGDLELDDFESITTNDEVAALCEALDVLREQRVKRYDPEHYSSPLHDLTAVFQQAASKEVSQALARDGLPRLRVWLEAALAGESVREDDVLFILKMLVGYQESGDIALIARIAQKPIAPDHFLWSIAFDGVDADHPHALAMVDALRDPIPPGFIGITYLDMANQLAIADALPNHPFNSQAGLEILAALLSDPDPEHASYAHSATAALPFVRERAPLLAIARKHPDGGVRMEAAWAAAKSGDATGLDDLAAYALDPTCSAVAQRYLEELGHANRIPAAAREPGFRAVAEMAEWLAHPSELGHPPASIELLDARELHWPPTDDRRTVALVKYTDGKDAGVGMVGSVTFVLFGETTAKLPPEDVYALHCCWELEMNGDKRAPKKRTAKAGRKLLAAHNHGF